MPPKKPVFSISAIAVRTLVIGFACWWFTIMAWLFFWPHKNPNQIHAEAQATAQAAEPPLTGLNAEEVAYVDQYSKWRSSIVQATQNYLNAPSPGLLGVLTANLDTVHAGQWRAPLPPPRFTLTNNLLQQATYKLNSGAFLLPTDSTGKGAEDFKVGLALMDSANDEFKRACHAQS